MGTAVKRYEEWTPEQATADAEAAQSESGGQKHLKLKMGKNKLRILPPRPGTTHGPFLRIQQHAMQHPKSGKWFFWECSERGKKGEDRIPCPVCKKGNDLDASRNPADNKAAKSYFPSMKALCNVVARDSDADEIDMVVQVATLPKSAWQQLNDSISDKDAGFGNFTNPDTGHDVIVEKYEEMGNTKYKARVVPRSVPLALDQEVADALLDGMHDLRRAIRLLTLAEVRQLAGYGDDDDDDEDDRPAPRKLGNDNKPRRNIADVVDDD